MVGIPAASSTLTVVASTPRGGRLHFMNRFTSSLSCAHVEVTLRATSRRVTGVAMFTVVQKIALLGLLLLTTLRCERLGQARRGGAVEGARATSDGS
jgi:hypothetical protein